MAVVLLKEMADVVASLLSINFEISWESSISLKTIKGINIMCLKEGKEGVSGKLQAFSVIKLSFSSPMRFSTFVLPILYPIPLGVGV